MTGNRKALRAARQATRERALERPELRELGLGWATKPGEGPTSPPVRELDPATRALIDKAIADRLPPGPRRP